MSPTIWWHHLRVYGPPNEVKKLLQSVKPTKEQREAHYCDSSFDFELLAPTPDFAQLSAVSAIPPDLNWPVWLWRRFKASWTDWTNGGANGSQVGWQQEHWGCSNTSDDLGEKEDESASSASDGIRFGTFAGDGIAGFKALSARFKDLQIVVLTDISAGGNEEEIVEEAVYISGVRTVVQLHDKLKHETFPLLQLIYGKEATLEDLGLEESGKVGYYQEA